MSDLTAKIRAKLQPTYTAPWAMKQYRAALGAAVDLHKPVMGQGYDMRQARLVPMQACTTCGTPGEYAVPWPCPELRKIAQALGIEVTGE